MEDLEHIKRSIQESIEINHKLMKLAPQIHQISRLIADALSRGKKIILFGNGGSAADAIHLAAEFLGKLTLERNPYPAIALSSNPSAITAIGNDYGFEHVFSRQLQALGSEGDIAIGISTSGRSRNVINAIQLANELGLITIGLTGEDGGDLANIAKYVIQVPSRNTQRIQEAHILIGHLLAELAEKHLK